MSDHTLAVRRWGDGPPVLFLHGLGASARYWEAVAAQAGAYAGVAPDLLGFGWSPKPPDSAYDVDAHLAAVRPLLEQGSLVVGHSTGAVLAAALAAAHRSSVAGLLLLGLPAFADEASARAGVGRLGLLARLTVDGRPAARVLCEAMCRFRPLAVALAPLVIRDLPPAIAADAARHTWTSYSRTLNAVVVSHRPLPDVVAAGTPTVLMHGQADRTAPVENVEELAGAARAAGAPVILEIVDGDHHLAVRRPQLVAERLGRLLAEAGER